MSEKIITCITCPIGCNIVVRGEGDTISYMEGSRCERGEEYARDEFINPVRILTTTIKVEGADTPLVPVRSDKPVPKELLFECMKIIKSVTVKAPVCRYDILVPDILGTGANICATGTAQ